LAAGGPGPNNHSTLHVKVSDVECESKFVRIAKFSDEGMPVSAAPSPANECYKAKRRRRKLVNDFANYSG